MHVDFLWSALGLPFSPRILKIADQFLLFGIDRDHGLFGPLKLLDAGRDILKLRIPIGLRAACPRFSIGVQALRLRLEESANPALTNRVAGFP